MMILFKRWKVMAVFFVVVVATIVLRTVTQPSVYEVTAAILVKRPGTDVSMAVATGRPVDFRVTLEDLNSEIEILKNRELIERVVYDLGSRTSKPPSLPSRVKSAVKGLLGRPSMSPLDARVTAISRQLDFWTVAGTHVLELSFKTEDPAWGTEVLDALIKHYLDFRLQVHMSPEVLTFFDQQTNMALDRLTTAEEALEDFVDESGVSNDLDNQLNMAMERLDHLEALASDARVARDGQRSRVNVLRARLADVPERLASARQENRNSAADALSRALVNLRLRRDDLLTRGFSESNSRVRDLQSQIDLAEEQLAEAEDVGLDGTEINEVHQRIRSDLLTSEAELDGLESQYATLLDEVARAREIVEDLQERTLPLTRLQREATSAEETYLLYKRKSEETRISQAMDQQQAVNVSVARPPRPPVAPGGMSLKMVVALAVVLGTAGALALGFAMEYLDRSYTTADQLEQDIGITVLASIQEWEPRKAAALAARHGSTA